MTTATAPAPGLTFDRTGLAALLAAHSAPEWVTERRRAALEALEALGLPDRRSENWMRTDLRMFKPQAWGLRTEPAGSPPADLLAAAITAGDLAADGWLDDGAALPGAPDWRVVHAPGHTDDSTCLYHRPTRTLISGDSVVSFAGRAWCNPEYVDAERSAGTAERLRSLPVEHLLPGHGQVVTGADVMGAAWGCDDRPPRSGRLRALWRIAMDRSAPHPR